MAARDDDDYVVIIEPQDEVASIKRQSRDYTTDRHEVVSTVSSQHQSESLQSKATTLSSVSPASISPEVLHTRQCLLFAETSSPQTLQQRAMRLSSLLPTRISSETLQLKAVRLCPLLPTSISSETLQLSALRLCLLLPASISSETLQLRAVRLCPLHPTSKSSETLQLSALRLCPLLPASISSQLYN